MPLTLKDIARMVGVAESTVSRAINNKPGVGAKTKQEIMKIVKEYNFKPNQLAQGLAKKETHILALLFPDLDNPGFPNIIRSVEEIANQEGYQVILCNTNNNLEKEKVYLELVLRNQVDGAIIVGGDLTDKHILNLALKEDASIVLINRLSEEMLIPTVLIDNAQGGYLATEHLLDTGLKRIGIIMGSREDYLESEKLAGYKRALTEKGLTFTEELVFETGGLRQDGYQAFLRFMELDQPPQGFFVTGDLLATGLVEAIKMGGFFIPNDFMVVNYGESLVSSIINPSLTVVAEPLAQLGKIAVKYLIKLINEEELSEMIKVLEPVLKMRDSTSHL